ETMWPIHVAAKLGDAELLRLLLLEGATLDQRTSAGRTAEDIARAADRNGSHQEVVALLGKVVVCNLRDAVTLMDSNRFSKAGLDP
ncbi:unnamed protein product, partial [Effrenium voratum]